MVDPYEPPPAGDAPGPPVEPPEPPGRRLPVGWIIATVLSLAVIAVLVVMVVTGGGEDEPAAEDPTTSTTVVDAGAGPSATTVTSEPGDAVSPQPTDEDASGSTDPSGEPPDPDDEDPDAGDPEPFSWTPGLLIDYDGDEAVDGEYIVTVDWTDASGEDHYAYILDWESGGAGGGDFGTLPGDTTWYDARIPCGAVVTFDLVARDAGEEELGRGSIRATLADCEPDPTPPSGLTASTYVGHEVAFSWTPGSGYDRYGWEASVTRDTIGSTELGAIEDPDQAMFTVTAGCDTTVDFTLTALMADGTEIGRLSERFEAAPCPGVFVVSGAVREVAPGTGYYSFAECPAGSAVVGGGFRTEPETAAMPYPGWIYHSLPSDTGWTASIAAPPERALSIQAYAVCMAHRESSIARQRSGEIRSGRLRSVVAECPAGTFVSGGGFSTADTGVNMLVNARDGNGWRVTGFNPLASSAEFTALAVCVEGEYITVAAPEITGSAADGELAPNEAVACPIGTVLTGGGFASADAYFEESYPVDSGGRLAWHVAGRNRRFEGPAGPAVAVEGSAVCLTFPP